MIAVVFHSGYGHTKRLAEVVAQGAAAELVVIDSEGNLTPEQWETLNKASAIIFGSPTYMGNVSWQFKKFADASSKIWFAQGWKDKLFAGFTNSASMNGDKHSSLYYMITLAMQHGGLWAGSGMLPANTKASTRNDVNYLGSFAGAMAVSPTDASVEEMLPGDLETGHLFGARIAKLAEKFG